MRVKLVANWIALVIAIISGVGIVYALPGDYVATIGMGFGTSNNRFRLPEGVTTDYQGNISVADKRNHRVQIYDLERNYVATLGGNGRGSANNQFNAPVDVTIDLDGRVWVVDQGNHRLQLFDRNYDYVATLGGNGRGDANDQFNTPEGVAEDAQGNIYVADRRNHRVQIFDRQLAYYATIGGQSGQGSDEFRHPSGVVVSMTGHIYVVDRLNHRVQVFDADLVYNATIGGGGIGFDNDHFFFPDDVAVDRIGNIYVADRGNHRVQVFDALGSYIRTIGQTQHAGASQNRLRFPSGVAVDRSGNLYVADGGNHRVQVFDAEDLGIVLLNGCFVDAPGQVQEQEVFSVVIRCGNLSDVYGFQFELVVSGDAMPSEALYELGTFVTDVGGGVLVGINQPSLLAVTRRTPVPAADGTFSLGSIQFQANSVAGQPGMAIISLESLVLGDLMGNALGGGYAYETTTYITIMPN